jgi:putative glycosyltransferase (TIGR04348 family)
VRIVEPARVGADTGNRVTARRWQRRLRELGWDVEVAESWQGEPCDVLVALHAVKSRPSILRFCSAHPERPLVVAISGTDVYGDGDVSAEALDSLRRAHRVVALQEGALARLPAELRSKVAVVHQSVELPPDRAPAGSDRTDPERDVLMLAHLRAIKDPLLAAEAARIFPASSKLRIRLVGASLDPGLAEAVANAAVAEPRFAWIGPRDHDSALRMLRRSLALLSTSHAEGGANSLSEAIAAGVPIVATDIDCSRALLGDDHPGLFPTGDAAACAAILLRLEREPAFRAHLAEASERRRALVDPARERNAWGQLLREVLREAQP